MPRLFVGLEIPDDVARGLVVLRGGLPGARWIEPSDYHITLRFLGDIDDRTADMVDHELSTVSRPSVAVRLTELGSFGGMEPRSLHVMVEANPALNALQAEVERIVRRCGIGPDKRRFAPHVTLARLRGTSPLDVAQFIAGKGFIAPTRFLAQRFVLFSSRASVGGGPYIVEATYPLQRAAA